MTPVPIMRFQLGNTGFRPMLHTRLAEGRMSAPAVSSDALSALQKGIQGIVDALTVEVNAVAVEFDDVAPATVRVEPGRKGEISYVGVYSAQEIRSILLVAARELGNRLERLAGGSLAPYMSAGQAQAVADLQTLSGQIVAALQNQDTAPIDPGHQADVQKYLDMHLASVTQMLQNAEKGVVQAEAGSVPVLEPYEKGPSTGTIVAGIGVAAGIGILIWFLS
jgi:hypothetical protein